MTASQFDFRHSFLGQGYGRAPLLFSHYILTNHRKCSKLTSPKRIWTNTQMELELKRSMNRSANKTGKLLTTIDLTKRKCRVSRNEGEPWSQSEFLDIATFLVAEKQLDLASDFFHRANDIRRLRMFGTYCAKEGRWDLAISAWRKTNGNLFNAPRLTAMLDYCVKYGHIAQARQISQMLGQKLPRPVATLCRNNLFTIMQSLRA